MAGLTPEQQRYLKTEVKDGEGKAWVYVDRLQDRQTGGYWVNTKSLVESFGGDLTSLDDEWWRYCWDSVSRPNRNGIIRDLKANIDAGYLMLCRKGELDPGYLEPERNEYGEVSP